MSRKPQAAGRKPQAAGHRGAWVPADLATTLSAMAGFRNALVHGYDTVDLDIVRDVVTHRLVDLLAFVGTVRGRLHRP